MLLFVLPAFSADVNEVAKPLEVSVTFDWISKSQIQRDENISQIQNLIFSNGIEQNYPKKEFKAKYSEFLKDSNHWKNYAEITNGKKEDADKYYCGFSLKNGLLIAYGIQYKNNMKNIYYYDSMGTLRWVDVFSDNYPKFPYFSYQYSTNGKLVAAYYYVSDFDQYVFDENRKFKGRWNNEKMYNNKAKVVMTRSNW